MDNEATYQLPTTEPDPRVQLAYERTFLAYERTRIAWVRKAVLGSVSRARDDVGIARPALLVGGISRHYTVGQQWPVKCY